MKFTECLKSAVKNVFSNKMRTFLTMLGIIIGISSVIMIVSIGNGSQAAIAEEFESFNTGRLTVSLVGSRDIETRDLLTMDDYEMLQGVEGIQYLAPVYSGNNAVIKLMDPKETNTASITGTTADYRYINNETVLFGRYISDNDIEMKNQVAVIQDTTALKVFGESSETVIGEKISVKTWKGTNKFTVIGITENSNAEAVLSASDEYPDEVTVPITTAMKVFTSNRINNLQMTPEEVSQKETVKEAVLAALSDFHSNTDKYYIQDTTDMVDSINSILSYVTLFIGFVAAISLLVGGIGVMNIMMVTVTERTREIGIRKAIGAKNKDIRIQFLMEAMILTGSGGLLGLLFGWGGALAVGHFVDIAPVMSLNAICGAVSISMAIGIIFGVTPANKAALLDPIEALRFE